MRTLSGWIIAIAIIECSLFVSVRSEVLWAKEPDSNRNLVDAAQLKNWKRVQELIHETPKDLDQTQSDGMSALHWAVYWNEPSIVSELLAANAKANSENQYGMSPLALACENANTDIVRSLLSAGAKANHTLPGNQTLVMTASRAGNRDIVAMLTEAGADIHAKDRNGQTALMWAAAEGNAEIVRWLLDRGANPNEATLVGFTASFFACREGHWPVVAELLSAGVDVNAAIRIEKSFERAPRSGMSGLMFAVESGHYELAIRLADAGADPNDQRSGLTPLHALCWVRRTKVGDNPEGDPSPRGSGAITSLQFVRELVRRGADVNRRLETGKGGRAQMKPQGSTPFLYASRTVDLPLMKTLLELGADPHAGNADDCKPINAVAGIGVIAVGEEPGTVPEVMEAIQFLLDHGADINAVDQNGETAMHGAAYRNYPEVVAFLAERGAKPQIWNNKNKYGWTPTMIAQGNRPGSFKPSPETVAAIEKLIKQ
jgi:ankyrin repeat protein